MLNKLIKQLTYCAAFCNWFFRAIAHSIAKKYNITHTHHTHTHIYKYIHKYSRVTPQNDISFEWTRPMRDTVRALKIPRNSARFYVSSPDKRPNSCDQQRECVTLEQFVSALCLLFWDSPSLRLTASKAKPNVHLVPAWLPACVFYAFSFCCSVFVSPSS